MAGVWVLVAIPAALVLTCGILILVYQRSLFDVTMGLLLVSFCAAIGAGAALTLVGIRSDRKLAALQIDFVSKVSHELKTPLTSIRMFVETLRLGRVSEPEQVERCLDVIEKETDRLSTLIGRLLSWGAMEAGAFRVRPEPTDPRALVQRAIEAFEPQTLSGEVRVEVRVPDALPTIQADVPALVDALLNLLNNAKKYRGDSQLIEVLAEERPEGAVAISVRDHGIGIEPKHHKRIFERFYRADERYSRGVGGTGLGLAIARHVVLAHEGQIEVTSKPKEGSTFTIVLPTVDALRKQANE
ncbi:MAG: ATP-binding protein [Deltaproteobacteria bacterium]|nr:ATP-binding protein [Deltaproteobacteria bacterium]